MAASRFEQACAAQEVFLVSINKAGVTPFQLTDIRCLGATDLNGSTVVVIISPWGAAMANIGPRPSLQNEDQATGDSWVHRAMGTLNTLRQLHSNLFGPDVSVYGVLVQAIYQGELALPDQVRIIRNQLESWNIPTHYGQYQVQPSSQPREPGQGTVLVDGRDGYPSVWANDLLVFEL